MTRHCSCSSPCRSEPAAIGWRVLLAIALLALGSSPRGEGAGSCPGCGTVAGSIQVWQASLRTEGPKHDRDVVVALRPLDAVASPPSQGRVSMDQKGLVFLPHVLAIQKGTTVTFLNSDPDPHNVYFLDDRTGDTLDIGTWGPGVSVDHRFEEPGTVITLCKLHLEMAAYIVVVDNPWFTVAEIDPGTSLASFEIRGVPAGEYALTVWHKKLKQKGGEARITVTAGGATRAEVVITKARYAQASD